MRKLLPIPLVLAALATAGPAFAAGQPGASCEDPGASRPRAMPPAALAIAEGVYAGSEGTPSAANGDAHAVSQYDIACSRRAARLTSPPQVRAASSTPPARGVHNLSRAVHRAVTGTAAAPQPLAAMEPTREHEVLRAGDLEVRPADHLALVGAGPSLSMRELELLAALARSAGPDRSARRALRDGLGRAAARARPLRRRLRPQAAVEAGPRDPGLRGSSTRTSASVTGSSRSTTSSATRAQPTSRTHTSHPFHKGVDNREQDGFPMRNNRLPVVLAVAGALAFGVAACGDDDNSGSGMTAPANGGGELKGKITIDGSSTVAPFTEAAAELFNEENPDVKVTVGISGTGGGFEKFCAGETDISDASRPIKPDEEAPVCEKAASSTPRSRSPTTASRSRRTRQLAVDCLTTDQLKQLWNKGSKVKSLGEVDPEAARHGALALRAGHRFGHVRLLHRRDQRRGGRQPRGLRGFRGRQPARHRCLGRRGRPRLLRLLLLRGRGRTSSTWSVSTTAAGTASSRRPRRSRTAPTSRCRARCSCIRARRR